MLAVFALLLLATAAVHVEGSTFEFDDVGYIQALLDAAGTGLNSRQIAFPFQTYVVEFEYKNVTNYLILDEASLAGSFPTVTGTNVGWWGNSSIFHVYADAEMENHTVIYKGIVGTPGNFSNITINVTKNGYSMSTYKKFVENGTTFSLPVHILDQKYLKQYYYNVSIEGASEEYVSSVEKAVYELELVRVRDYSLTSLTTLVLATMDTVYPEDYATYV